MSNRVRRTTGALLIAACLLQAGCSPMLRPKPDATCYYLLAPLSGSGGSEAGRLDPTPCTGLSIGLAPVRLPAYLDRDQMVTRPSPNRIEVAASDRWAEPLAESFGRVLAENLAALLRASRMVRHPVRASGLDYEVQVDVERFECKADHAAGLAARWVLKDGRTRDVLLSRRMALTRPARAADTAGSVAALSEALGELSLEIAAAICQARSQAAASAPRPGFEPAPE
ncbi:MAG: PqiC family protein [bacterium]